MKVRHTPQPAMDERLHGVVPVSGASRQALSCVPLRGRLLCDEAMARHVSWRAGGPVAYAYQPQDVHDLCAFLARLRHDLPLLFVGLGSNLLVRDGGYDGVVVFTHGAVAAGLYQLREEADGLIYAEAGVASPKLARFVAAQNRVGAEFLAGVPGSLGGALAMNAGCHGSQTWEFVERVLTVDRFGQLRERSPEDFVVRYRHVGLKTNTDEWFVAAWLRFAPGDGAAARQRMRELLEKRNSSQPLKLPNCGSVFRNPSGDHAARLIEAAGLKGLRVGGACVSEMHSNFIVNPENEATASEIEMLIGQIRARVHEKFAVELQPEVRIVGVAGALGSVKNVGNAGNPGEKT